MRKKLAFILVGILCTYLLLPNPAFAQTQQAEREISTGPNSGGFIETLPATYSKDSTKRYPLMIFLAGEGQLGNGTTNLPIMEGTGPTQIVAAGQWPDSFTVHGRSFSFIIITPQFKSWPSDADVDSVLQYSLKHYRVDTGRIYMTGLSMGGGATWSYASSSPHAGMLAAILPISGGTMWSGRAGAMAIAGNNLPVYGVTNRWDPNVDDTTTINNVNLINSIVPHCVPVALDTVYADSGHDAWTKTYYTGTYLYNGLNCYQWMLQYSRDPGDTVPTPPPPPPLVKLSSFTATLGSNNKSVNVAWTTSLERGNKYFIVQRSTDSVSFSNIDTVMSKAPPGGGASYQMTDTSAYVGNDYYRLESIDTTGNSTFYNIVKVKVPAPAPPPPPPPPTPTVELSAYSASLATNGKSVDILWTTLEETGNSYFVIQRSTDSVNFSNLATVPSTAKSGKGATYRYTDNSPVVGNDYYRLESVDSSGKDSIYPVLLVVVPNPSPTPLVQLSAYTATLAQNQKSVNVNWTTAKEVDNKYFVVERSTDSVNFTNIATVFSTAKSGQGASYQITDNSPVVGKDYYRLESYDSTNHDSVFSILMVTVPAPPPPAPPTPVVQLSAYSATLAQNKKSVNVNWTTSKEVDIQDFIVQRSTDSVNFTNIATVPSTAPSGQGASYQSTDSSAVIGKNYYRVESVDSTGHDSLFSVLLVVVPAPTQPPPGDTIPPPPTPPTAPTPVIQLSAYTATLAQNNKSVNVNWTTSREVDIQEFIVQRSTDSVNFTNIATVPSTAPSGQGASYQSTDSSPAVGKDYYRLESVDSTGHDSLYSVLLVVVPAPTQPPPGDSIPPTDTIPQAVTLTIYTATAVDNGKAVNVIWTTASEQGNKYFVVQRSADSLNFDNLDTVAAVGKPDSGASYIYTDNSPVTGNNYYRLQRFDITGNDTLYKVLKVATDGKAVATQVNYQEQLVVSPNPATTGLINLHLVDSTLGTMQVSFTDMQGRTLRVLEFQKQDILWDQSIDIANLPRGCYVLQIRSNTIRAVRTILKD